MKYFSKEQIFESLKALSKFNQFFGSTFLAAKREKIPIGKTLRKSLDAINDNFLSEFYRLDPRSNCFFRVFRYNSPQQFWVRGDYSGKGLQKLNTSTFKDAFIHPKNTDSWGWSINYVDVLSRFLPSNEKIPLYHSAVWIFRNVAWSDSTKREHIIDKFRTEFNLTPTEIKKLFSLELNSNLDNVTAFQQTPVKWDEIEALFEPPPDVGPEKGGILGFLEMEGIGPLRSLIFEPAPRLNIITGDNGLGKTFLLEVAWWCLTGKWADIPAFPRRDIKGLAKAQVKFQISGHTLGKPQVIVYSRDENRWPERAKQITLSGLAIYARVDGSFALWDPTASSSLKRGVMVFNRDEVWNGKTSRIEGLVRDWTKWQDKPSKYPFEIFKKVLARMSPPEMGELIPGEPVRLPDDSREIPTIKHSYGDVPILHESAGIRRVITLAYLIVWTWNEHKTLSDQFGNKLENQMVVLIDELEAHLHPRWQRVILPALLGVSSDLSNELNMQLIVATHSPLVLASAESTYSEATDKLFHLNTKNNGKVSFDEIPFVKYGGVDSWLTSMFFNLKHARSKESELTIQEAINMQTRKDVTVDEVASVTNRLIEQLPPEDPFWLRWVLFAKKHGVEI